MMSRRARGGEPFSLFAFQDIITAVMGLLVLITMMLMIELLDRTTESPAYATEQVADELEAAAVAGEEERRALELRLQESQLVVGMTAEDVERRLRDLDSARRLMEEHRDRTRALQRTTDKNARDAERQASTQDLSVARLETLQAELAAGRAALDELKRRNRVVFHTAAGATKQAWLLQLDAENVSAAKVGEAGKPQSFVGIDGLKRWLGSRDPARDYFVLLIKPESIGLFETVQEELKRRRFDIGYDLLASDQTAIDPETGAGVREP